MTRNESDDHRRAAATDDDSPRRGRRAGKPDTRAHIAETALTLFLRDGFSATSMRAVARAAECDPALVHHYFSSKEQLFFDAMNIWFDVDSAIAFITATGPRGVGRRLFAALTAIYEKYGPELLGNLVAHDDVRSMFVRVISGRITTVSEEFVPGRHARRALAAHAEAIIAGFATTRYLLATEHAAALTPDEAVAAYGDLLQCAIDAAIPATPR